MNYKSILKAVVSGLILGLLWVNIAPESEEKQRIRVIDSLLPKTVMIEVDTVVHVYSLSLTKKGFKIDRSTETKKIIGSGVIVSSSGHVLSCNHLFNYGKVKKITIFTYYDVSQTSKVLAFSDPHDLALLKIDSVPESWVAELDKPFGQQVGQSLIAVGYPFGNPYTVTHGMLSALNNDQFGYNLIQSDTFINPGNSGGPLFTSTGKLVGINRLIVSNNNPVVFSGLGYATSINQITEFLVKHKIIKFKR